MEYEDKVLSKIYYIQYSHITSFYLWSTVIVRQLSLEVDLYLAFIRRIILIVQMQNNVFLQYNYIFVKIITYKTVYKAYYESFPM